MASGLQPAQIVGPGSVPTNKGQNVNSSSVGCLPFPSHSRQHSDNYPDVVDNETYLQRPFSESSNDVSANADPSQQMPSSSQTPDNGHGDIVAGYRAPGTYVQRVPETASEPIAPVSGQTPYANEQNDVMLGRPTPVTLPTYRQIQTRDINVGISTRLDQRADALPDLLHSHVPQPPRQVVLPPQHRPTASRNNRRTRNTETQTQSQHRTREAQSRTRHGRRIRTRSTSSSQVEDPVCKAPCVQCFVKVTSFRWVLVVLSLLGVCCVVTGIVLAALHAAGNSFLFLAIMFIGTPFVGEMPQKSNLKGFKAVLPIRSNMSNKISGSLGVLLVIVVGVGWKCTPRGHEPLHALFGVGDFQQRREQRRHRTHRSRDNNWYGGVLYPEFQYRRPPPTYAASMQDYQQQLYLAQQQQEQYLQTAANSNNESYSLPSSPPPSYRSRASTIHSGIHITFPPNQEDHPDSRPPTYRSRRGSSHPRPPIPMEEFESMDSGPADVSFAGPDSSAQRTVVESTHNISNNESESNTVPQTHIPDSTVTVNGRVIEPSVENSSPRSQSENVVTGPSTSASSGASGNNSVTNNAQSTSAQSNNNPTDTDNEDRVETSL